MIGYIYHIVNDITGKHYIGITENYKRRFTEHRSELNSNSHHSPKLQNAWNYYGSEHFTFTVKEVEIQSYDDLYELEIAEIKKYDSCNNGYNCNSGGKITDWRQKVKNEDIVGFLCVNYVYGEGYGKTFEECLGWSKGTASAAYRKVRFLDANCIFENLSMQEKREIAQDYYTRLDLENRRLQRQLSQGGCQKAYILTLEDYYFAFAAQELGYTYRQVADYFQIKPATVKDWFNGRSRAKERKKYNLLTSEEKSQYVGRVKIAELSGKAKA